MPDSAPLSAAREALLVLSASIASRTASRVDAALDAALADAPPEQVEEAILQAHLFVGFPDALNVLDRWRTLSRRPAPPAAAEECATWGERGPRTCASIYGRNYPKLRQNVARIHPDLDRWMVDGGYGRVLGRAGLDLQTRELCIVALLVVWDVPRQLHSHLRGAMNTGATQAEIERAIEIACACAAPDVAARARSLWAEVAPRDGALGRKEVGRCF